MKLEGLHHAVMITCDAQRNVDFYAGVLDRRLVMKTVTFGRPGACRPRAARRGGPVA